MTQNKPGRSEFEKDGPYPFGGYGTVNAYEKLLIIKRTEQDPDGPVNLGAKADKFEHGGIDSDADLINGIQR